MGYPQKVNEHLTFDHDVSSIIIRRIRSILNKSFLALDKYLWFKKTKELIAGGTILDLGGGEGLFESLFFEKNRQATILEVSAKYRAGTIPYVVYGGKALPFKNKSFDIGVALQTLEHIPSESRQVLVTELARVIREQIILSFPVRRLHFERLFIALFSLYDVAGLSNMKRFYEEHLRYGLPKQDFIFTASGFTQTLSEYYFGRLSCLLLLIQLILPTLIPLSPLFAKVTQKLNEREPVFALLCWRKAKMKGESTLFK